MWLVSFQSRNEKTFEEFSEGVIEYLYLCRRRGLFCLCCVLCIWVVAEKGASLRVGCEIPIVR